MMKRCIPFMMVVVVFCLIMALPSGAPALEGGGSHYFGGGEDFGAGSGPPPGLSLNLSVLYYKYDRIKGNDGHTQDVPGGFQVNGISNSLKIMYVTKIDVLGGNLGCFLTPALAYQYGNFAGRSQAKTGMGDLNFGVIVKKDWDTFQHVIGADIFAPTGAYKKGDIANLGVNYWTFGPTYSFTYLGNMESPVPGFEVSARMAYYFHTTNNATGYTSGQEFSADYLVGKRFGPIGEFRVGVNGNLAVQLTDDTPTPDGHRTKQFTVGPALQYFFLGKSGTTGAMLTLKAQFGVYDVNRPEGSYFWLKFWYPL